MPQIIQGVWPTTLRAGDHRIHQRFRMESGNCASIGMDLDGLPAFLEARDNARIVSSVVWAGG
jgi:hypothetical protein